jgi:succinate dehydrogenase/fumarate reductase-like Fe-S protein
MFLYTYKKYCKTHACRTCTLLVNANNLLIRSVSVRRSQQHYLRIIKLMQTNFFSLVIQWLPFHDDSSVYHS